MKDQIKRLIPPKAMLRLQAMKNKHRVRCYFKEQARDIDRYFAFPGNTGKKQLETQMIFFSHQLEKGLSHSDFRAGFGKRPLGMIAEILNTYYEKGYETNSFEVRLTFSVLRAYLDKHVDGGYKLPEIFTVIYRRYHTEIDDADPNLGGAIKTQETDYVKYYHSVIENRISIREYADTPVDINAINKALEVAVHAPSVCNRQSERVRVVSNPEMIQRTLHIQGGWNGYKDPPVLILVTSHLSSFNNAIERNEPYVDGGIFSMALLGAIEEQGLAACPLNTMFSKEQDDSVRQILDVPREEALIMLIALGNKPKTVLHPASQRRDYTSIVKYMK